MHHYTFRTRICTRVSTYTTEEAEADKLTRVFKPHAMQLACPVLIYLYMLPCGGNRLITVSRIMWVAVATASVYIPHAHIHSHVHLSTGPWYDTR